jgi:hypothetical protein
LIGGVIKVIATVILGFVIAMNEIAAFFGDEKARAEADRLSGVVNSMWSPDKKTRDEADNNAAAATLRNASAQDAAAVAATKVAEAFTNVPTGYKLALARFNATGEGENAYAAAAAASFGGGGGGNGGIVVYGDLNVSSTGATTAEELAAAAKKATTRQRAQNRGNATIDD